MTEAPRSPGQVVRDVIAPRVPVILAAWRAIVIAGIAGGLLGVVTHFLRPKSYTSSGLYVLLTQQSGGSRLGAFGALASQIGLSDLSRAGVFDAYTLARLATSDRALLVAVAAADTLATRDTSFARGWYDIARRPADRTPKRAEDLLRTMSRIVSVTVEPRSGTIAMGVSAPMPELAERVAVLVVRVVDSLTADLLARQARIVREEAERQVATADQDLKAAENHLQEFLSRNRTISSPNLQFEARALERQATLRSTLYERLAAGLAEARLEEKRSTPAVQAVSPPRRPVRPEGPGGATLLVLGVFFGAAGAAVRTVWARSAQSRA